MNCNFCKKEFKETADQRYALKEGYNIYCSKQCSYKMLSRIRKGKNNPFYGKKRSKEFKEKIRKANFKTGMSIIGGYLVLNPIAGKRKAIRYHRYLMQKHLGRKLKKCEFVHHKDDNRLNNNIKNLELISPSDHTKHHNKNPNRKWKPKSDIEIICVGCKKKFIKKKWQEKKYCNQKCYTKHGLQEAIKKSIETRNYIKRYYKLTEKK